MNGVTAGAQQIATWGTGDIIIYTGAIGLLVVGILCMFGGHGMRLFGLCIVGIGLAAGALGASRALYGWFHSASIEQPSGNRAFASLTPPPGSDYRLTVGRDGSVVVSIT